MIRRGSRVANHSSLYIVGYIEADQGAKTMTTLKVLLTSSALLLSAISAGAQQPATPAAPAAPAAAPPAAAPAAPLVYGAPITLEMAKG
jgi:hypothetical protein